MTVTVREELPFVEDILGEREAVLGLSLEGYRNHVCRMVNFGLAFGELSPQDEEKVVIAGVFHDLGIWTDNTFDYLPPSIDMSREYLTRIDRADLSDHISQMIGEHHKLRRFKGDALTEVFRKADLVDVSLGVINFGLDAGYIKDVKERFPNNGFHAGLLKTAGRWICRHPLNPVPVLRW